MIFEYAKTRKDTRTIFRYDIVTNKVEPYYCFDKDELTDEVKDGTTVKVDKED